MYLHGRKLGKNFKALGKPSFLGNKKNKQLQRGRSGEGPGPLSFLTLFIGDS